MNDLRVILFHKKKKKLKIKISLIKKYCLLIYINSMFFNERGNNIILLINFKIISLQRKYFKIRYLNLSERFDDISFIMRW